MGALRLLYGIPTRGLSFQVDFSISNSRHIHCYKSGYHSKINNLLSNSLAPDETVLFENFSIHEITCMGETQNVCQNILGKAIYLIPLFIYGVFMKCLIRLISESKRSKRPPI